MTTLLFDKEAVVRILDEDEVTVDIFEGELRPEVESVATSLLGESILRLICKIIKYYSQVYIFCIHRDHQKLKHNHKNLVDIMERLEFEELSDWSISLIDFI